MPSETRPIECHSRKSRGRQAAELRRWAGARGFERPLCAGLDGRPNARAVQRQFHVLQRQYAHQPHQRVRLHLRLLRVPGRPRRSPSLRDGPRPDRRACRQASDRGATELHIVGGLHNKLPFEYYVDVVRWIKETAPEIHIKAYTAVEIEWFCKITRKSVEQILKDLIDAGLGSLPGGGAEIFHPEVREQICGAKASTESWLNIHRTAHRLGLHSNATMLYGHIDKPHHRIDHLVRLRELQDETGGFQTFIPLAFHPDNSQMAHIPKPSGLMDLKVMAISRLMLDNFPHIKAYWVMLGLKTAQIALSFGADDLDGTVVHEKIYHEAGAETPQEVDRRRDPPPDHRGRPGPRRARHLLSPRRTRSGKLDDSRAHRRIGARLGRPGRN